MFLDEDNNITNGWATLDDFEIIGDCYNALNSDILGVSYNDIIDDNNLVWIEFN